MVIAVSAHASVEGIDPEGTGCAGGRGNAYCGKRWGVKAALAV